MILRLVLDAEMFRVDVAHPPAADGAAETGAVGDEIDVAVLLGGLHRAQVYLVSAFELDLAEIPGRQRPVDIGGIHHGDGALPGQSLASGVFPHGLCGVLRHPHEGFRVRHPKPLGASYGNGFQAFRCHYRAHAGAAGGPVHIVDHAGEPATVFGAGSDRGKVDKRVLVGLFDGLFRFPHGPAPQVSGWQQAGALVFDMKVDGFRRPAFQDQQIIAGKFQFGAAMALVNAPLVMTE